MRKTDSGGVTAPQNTRGKSGLSGGLGIALVAVVSLLFAALCIWKPWVSPIFLLVCWLGWKGSLGFAVTAAVALILVMFI